MATRSQLPDSFYVRGTLLTLSLQGDETIARWLERVAFVLRYLESPENDGSEDFFQLAQHASRLHSQRITLGVTYRS